MRFDMTGIGGMLAALEKLNYAMNVQGKGFSIGTNVEYAVNCMPHQSENGWIQNRIKSGESYFKAEGT